ncbi:DctQ4: C4-TRAP dicarboxylate transporter [Desulfosarcina variabilis str. Montpellier]|uniref:TRAP transporter small permease n=1 Tax=Desulfosarcina variabilis TaxID=2300 RepID=UPI003AFB1DD0
MVGNTTYPIVFTLCVIAISFFIYFFPYRSKTKVLSAIDRGLSQFEDWTLLVSVGIALIALFLNVVLRYGFNYTLAWSEELVREVIIYTTFIGCCVAVKNRSMIRIDATVQLIPKLKTALTYFSNGVVIIFSILMMYYGWLMAAMQARTFQKTLILKIPLVYLYSILPLTGALMLVRTLHVIYQDVAQPSADD